MKKTFMDFIESFKNSSQVVKEKFEEFIGTVRGNKVTLEMVKKVIIRGKNWSKSLEKIALVSNYSSNEYEITPFQASDVKAIKENFANSDLGYKVQQSDNKMIRVSLMPVTFARREKIVENCKQQLDESKKALRTLRIKAVNENKKEKSSNHKERNQKEIDSIINQFNKEIEEIFKKKSKELLAV